jgi:hypothetical protein
MINFTTTNCSTSFLKGFFMTRLLTALFVVGAVALANPALAKKPVKKDGGKGSGAYCYQGADNIFIPAAQFPAKYRNSLRKGQKATINIAGFGPVKCVVY